MKKKILALLTVMVLLTAIPAHADDVYVDKGGYYHLSGVSMWKKGFQKVSVSEQYANSGSSISYQVLDSNYKVLEGKNWKGRQSDVEHYYNTEKLHGNNRHVYWIVPSGSTMSSVRTVAYHTGEGYSGYGIYRILKGKIGQ